MLPQRPIVAATTGKPKQEEGRGTTLRLVENVISIFLMLTLDGGVFGSTFSNMIPRNSGCPHNMFMNYARNCEANK
jgi:hypothetical protein